MINFRHPSIKKILILILFYIILIPIVIISNNDSFVIKSYREGVCTQGLGLGWKSEEVFDKFYAIEFDKKYGLTNSTDNDKLNLIKGWDKGIIDSYNNTYSNWLFGGVNGRGCTYISQIIIPLLVLMLGPTYMILTLLFLIKKYKRSIGLLEKDTIKESLTLKLYYNLIVIPILLGLGGWYTSENGGDWFTGFEGIIIGTLLSLLYLIISLILFIRNYGKIYGYKPALFKLVQYILYLYFLALSFAIGINW